MEMRLKVVVCAALVFALLPNFARAQSEYPDRPVRFLNSGGAANTVARILAEKMLGLTGKPFVVEVVPGAGGMLAASRVAKSPPDGYTLYMAGEAAMTTNVALYEKLPYDPRKDFEPITRAVDSVNILAVHPSVQANSIQELVALAKAQPGKLTFAAPGIGTSPHIAGELLKSMAKIDILHVPYREANAVIPDLLAGRVSMYFGNIASLLSLVRAGQLRALAVSSLNRVPLVPELPTIAESGYPGYHATTWVGIVAPAGTPKAIVDKLNQTFVKAMNMPDVQKRFADLGLITIASTPDELRQQIADDIPRKIKIIQDAGIKPQ
jgi:tripartite-type tricarboxylate transporter receptor subunit TctC